MTMKRARKTLMKLVDSLDKINEFDLGRIAQIAEAAADDGQSLARAEAKVDRELKTSKKAKKAQA